MTDKDNALLDFLQRVWGWLAGAIGALTTAVGFVRLVQGDTDLFTIVTLVIGVIASLTICGYVAFSRQNSPIQANRKIFRYPKPSRNLAKAFVVFVSLFVIAGGGHYYFQDWLPITFKDKV
jgi:hypothetical protein